MNKIWCLLLSLMITVNFSLAMGFEVSDDFLSYIKECENGIRKNWDKDTERWTPYHDGAGWHIAYGHLILDPKEYSAGITETQALDLLKKDLAKSYELANNHLVKKGVKLSTLPTKNKEMILDFAFNGCLLTHPKMLNAIVESDTVTQIREHKRYAVINGKRMELKDRNKRFFDRFLAKSTDKES